MLSCSAGEWAERRRYPNWRNGTQVACNNGTNLAGNMHELCSCISLTDGVKFNEQNNSIETGQLYIHIKFEVILMLLREDVVVLNPIRYQIL